jgi:hypothetical protein
MDLTEFIRESNEIEGIYRDPTKEEVQVAEVFIRLDEITVQDLCNLVEVFQPGARLRQCFGQNVTVGNHCPPPGGPEVREQLEYILNRVNNLDGSPCELHVLYETLHPFMDGNGRSGRMLWAWHMLRDGQDGYWLERGFKHTFYYQSLTEIREWMMRAWK